MGFLASVVWRGLGQWFDRKGLTGVAESCYRNAVASGGAAAGDAGFRLVKSLLDREENRQAVAAGEQSVKSAPGNARLWCATGAAYRRMFEMPKALVAYQRAVELDPDYSQALSNLGEWYLASGEPQRALDHIDRALKYEPGLLEALNNRVAVLYELGRFKDAEVAAREGIELHPDVAALHVNLGTVLLHTARARLAVKSFKQALVCDPSCPEANMSLAMLLGEAHRLAETLDFIEHEIEIKGVTAQRLVSLALAQQAKGDIAEAEITCRAVIEMQPGNVTALIALAGCMSYRSDHWSAVRLLEQALEANPQMPAIYSNIAFNVTYLPNISSDEVFRYHREWAQRYENVPDDKRFVHPPGQSESRPLRIGYVSGDFGRHPVGFLIRDVLRFHDRDNFYVHCYSMMRADDEITIAIKERADSWIDALLMSDDELAEQIHQDRIDILIDLSGHTAYNRLPSFTRRPAPVQATWIGYFHSTGMESIDYFITDPYTTPADSGQLFSEIPVYLPHTRFCYSPPDYAPEPKVLDAVSLQPIVFGSFNRIEKLVDPVIEAWARILKAIPESRILIKAGKVDNDSIREGLLCRFADQGIAADRIEMRPPSPHPDMLAQYGDIDIALDTFPFNGGMTTLEALWMGVPVVTMDGDGVVSRQTYSALANIGLVDQLSFSGVDDYVSGAISLATDRSRLVAIRRDIRARMAASPICKPDQFAHDLEVLYRQMWVAYCRGERLPSVLSP
jgi:predicted O-linked N-acetylglucosamine transferase (SPINDLY family)